MIETITSAKLITEKFKRVAMLASFRDSNFAGVLFNDNAGYVVHEEGHYLIKIHGKNLLAGQNRSFPYYHYAKNDFIRNDLVGRKPNGETVRLTLDFIESRFSLARPQFRIRVPVYHVMRQIYQLYPTKRSQTQRLILRFRIANQMKETSSPLNSNTNMANGFTVLICLKSHVFFTGSGLLTIFRKAFLI